MAGELPKTSQEPAAFQWTKLKEQAAFQVFEDRLSEDEIAAAAGVTRRALFAWRQHPDFQARITEHIEAFKARVLSRGIAQRERRVDALQDRWERMQRVIDERGEEMGEECPGGATGLMVRQIKSIGAGPFAREVREYKVDTGLLAELREHEKQAAQELGQWEERKVHSGPGGKAIEHDVRDLRALTPEQLVALHRQTLGVPGEG